MGKLPHQQAAELIPNPNPNVTLARALDLALGPRPNPNPKQAAKLIANLQEAMCRRQEEAELKLATARTAVPISPLPPPGEGHYWAARRLDDAMACRREHSVLLAGVDVVRVRRSPHFKQLWRGPGD